MESGGGGKAGWLATALHGWMLLGKAEELEGWCPWRIARITGLLWGNEGCAALNWQMSKQGIKAKIKLETSVESLVEFF